MVLALILIGLAVWWFARQPSPTLMLTTNKTASVMYVENQFDDPIKVEIEKQTKSGVWRSADVEVLVPAEAKEKVNLKAGTYRATGNHEGSEITSNEVTLKK